MADNFDFENTKLVCEHVTQIWYGFGKNKKKVDILQAIPGELYSIKINAFVINKNNRSSAFRVTKISNNKEIEYFVQTGRPHITATIANGFKASDSLGFVMLGDNSVEVHEIDFTLNSICRYN